MEENHDKIIFTTDDNEEVEFYVLEETKLGGVNYLLVADSNEDEAVALILKLTSGEDEESVYEIVEDDEELENISKIFEELLEDIVIE